MNARIIQHEKYQSMIEQKGEKHHDSINGEKAFNPFISRLLRKLGIGRNFLSTVKEIYENPRKHNGERLKNFSVRSGTRQGCSLSPLLFSKVLEVLARAIQQEKETKDIQTVKEEKLY